MVVVRASVSFEIGSVKLLSDANGAVRGLTFDPAVDPSVSPEETGLGVTEKIRKADALPRKADVLSDVLPTDRLEVDRLVNDLVRYFRGEKFRWSFDPDLSQETAFTRAVYERAMKIPYGETVSYGQIALDVGSPGGGRAVGQAMGRNRFSPVIPCHRVIAGDGRIGGFSGGLDLKRFLLSLEGVHL